LGKNAKNKTDANLLTFSGVLVTVVPISNLKGRGQRTGYQNLHNDLMV